MAHGVGIVKDIDGPGWPEDPGCMGVGEAPRHFENMCGRKRTRLHVLA